MRRPRGTGRINTKGYVQIGTGGKRRLEHIIEWERHNGPVPDGFQVHHKDENKQNNAIENLELLDATSHKRIHGGCDLRNGVWWKPCRICKQKKPIDIDNWYFAPNGRWPILGCCRPCHIRNVIRRKQLKRLSMLRATEA